MDNIIYIYIYVYMYIYIHIYDSYMINYGLMVNILWIMIVDM